MRIKNEIENAAVGLQKCRERKQILVFNFAPYPLPSPSLFRELTSMKSTAKQQFSHIHYENSYTLTAYTNKWAVQSRICNWNVRKKHHIELERFLNSLHEFTKQRRKHTRAGTHTVRKSEQACRTGSVENFKISLTPQRAWMEERI